MFCREQVAQVRDRNNEIQELDTAVVVVGNGGPHFVRGFIDQMGIDFPVLADPELETYRALPFKSGLASTFRPAVLKNALRTLKAGHRQGAVQGHAMQQGGVLILGPGDVEHYRYSSEVAGDHPDIEDLLQALRAAARGQ